MYRCTEFALLLQENGCCVHHSSCQRELHTPEPDELRNRKEDMQTRDFMLFLIILRGDLDWFVMIYNQNQVRL